jgi:hypothetical protein
MLEQHRKLRLLIIFLTDLYDPMQNQFVLQRSERKPLDYWLESLCVMLSGTTQPASRGTICAAGEGEHVWLSAEHR